MRCSPRLQRNSGSATGRWCEWRLVGKASDARRHGQGAVRTVAAVATTGEGPAAGARSSHDGQRRSELTAVAGGLPPLLSHRDRAPLRGSHLPWAGRLPMPPSPWSSPPPGGPAPPRSCLMKAMTYELLSS
ncbi:unnamed protein product [Urochloa humidicola]